MFAKMVSLLLVMLIIDDVRSGLKSLTRQTPVRKKKEEKNCVKKTGSLYRKHTKLAPTIQYIPKKVSITISENIPKPLKIIF